MKLEQQVCSLDLAKRLKELGVKQESAFYWIEWRTHKKKEKWNYTINFGPLRSPDRQSSAFTVAELGEIIFSKVGDMLTYGYPNTLKEWIVVIENKFSVRENYSCKADTEANARAAMLVYLIENGVVKP